MFEECKKYFNDNEFICSFISKAESAYHNKDYPTAITAMKNACRVFLEQSADYKSVEYTSLAECLDKIKAEFAQEKQRIVQETGYKTACKLGMSASSKSIHKKENKYTLEGKYTLIRRLCLYNDISEKSFEKHIEVLDLIERNGRYFLRRFRHTCAQENNGRPVTKILDELFPVSEELSFDEELATEYIIRHRSARIILRDESGICVLAPDVYVEDIYGVENN